MRKKFTMVHELTGDFAIFETDTENGKMMREGLTGFIILGEYDIATPLNKYKVHGQTPEGRNWETFIYCSENDVLETFQTMWPDDMLMGFVEFHI